MGPKKGGKDIVDDNSWRTLIEDTALNEENWSVKVILIEAAGSDQDRIYLNKFETFAALEKRFVIKNICKTETIFMVNQLGGEKKVKDDNLRVFEEGQAYLKDKKDIPPDIQALIIKHLIMKMKDEYLFIKRQRLQVRQGMQRESATMIDRTEVRGTVNVKPPEPEEPPPPPSKGKGKKGEPEPEPEPEPDEGKKYNTPLRVRGEEWRDKVYVDDFPTDGPELYVAVTGFVEPLLPVCLAQVGIPLSAVVQVRIDPGATKVPSTLLRATKRGQSQTEILTEKSLKFWEDLQLLRINTETADDLKNTAFVVFSPPYWDTDSLSGNPDNIYDELCYLMYDVQDLTRQHIHYLNNMDIITIPNDTEEQRYNNDYIQNIIDLPLECVTIYSVIDSILLTVCNRQELDGNNSQTSGSTAAVATYPPRKSLANEEKIEKAEALVNEVFSRLCKTDANKKAYRITYGEEYEAHKDPTVISYGDFAKLNTFHLGNINLENIVESSLYSMPIHNLWQHKRLPPRGELEAKINFHVNVLLSCFERDDVETAELYRLIHILSCRKLFNNRSSLKKRHLQSMTITEFKKNYLKRSVLAEPLGKSPSINRSGSSSPSFPSMTKCENTSFLDCEDSESQRIKFLFDCPDISELVSAAEIANEKPANHLIDDFEFFEDFSGISAYQILLDAFNKFNCVDYKYCEVTDCFLLMFFNSQDADGIAREEWRCHLTTPLCLQDFFDFVLEENYDWIQNEEKIYDERFLMKFQSECKFLNNPLAYKSCIENNDVGLDLLMEGSLKYQEIEVEEEQCNELEDPIGSSSAKKTTISPSSTDVDSKSSKKGKSTKVLSNKGLKSFTVINSETSLHTPAKPFFGYDLGDRRVEVFGKDATFFSKDGTYVTSLYTLIIPINVEYIALEVVPGNSFNQFWVHRALGDSVSQDIIDTCESFRITSKDQIMINIKKQTYNVPVPVMSISTIDYAKQKESFIGKSNIAMPEIFETKTYYSLFVTWPNGLITESVHSDNSPEISHIKQYHVTPMSNLDEEMRCVSLNGEVIIFKTNKDIEVLKPDGTYINITKCEKKIVVHDEPEEVSEASSDKNKKGKGKDKEKPKDKASKASSKSSKNALSDDEKVSAEKPLEFELIIEEFDIIESSGLRQHWVYDNSIDIEKLLIRTATDYCLGEIFSRRMDGTNILLNKDGVQVVTFPNKTRIITEYIIEDIEIYPEWTDEEKEYLDMVDSDTFETDTVKLKSSISQKSYIGSFRYSASNTSKKMEEEAIEEKEERSDGYVSVQIVFTIEHANFATITINKADENIFVDSPNGNKIVIDSNNFYKIVLDSTTIAKFDGENLHISYEACPECQSFTTCDIKIKMDDMCSVTKIQQNWLRMRDSFCKKVVVNEEGSISLSEELCSEEINPEETIENLDDKTADGKSEGSVISHGKCREMYLSKTVRFFVLRRELTCAELVHRSLLNQYRTDCRWQPWCSIGQYDTFGDNRSLLSILTPMHVTESEKWLMDSKLADKPKYLTYKDLKKDPGKGFYHWMRPYKRFEPQPLKPENVLPPRLPRAFVLRTLEQQWKESHREKFKGAKELSNAILKYRHVMQIDSETLLHVPIVDMRPEDERKIDDVIQALAHRIYEDLKIRLEDDVSSRAKIDITTKPPPPPEEASLEGEVEEEYTYEEKALEEERETSIKRVEAAEEMGPNLRRYWRRRAEEFKEEQFYKYLLRDGNVPPYFRNVLGGAIWWEMNSAAGEAVTKSERGKMKCPCADEAPPAGAEPYM